MPRRALRLLLLWPLLVSQGALAQDLTSGLTVGGDLALTSNYIYRGVSSSNNDAAAQGDLHVTGSGGTFLGIWGSTRDSTLEPYNDYELVIYLGHRFDLSSDWSATLAGRAHYLLGGQPEVSDDYQEISAALTWLDVCTFSVTGIPNAPRYWVYDRLSRAPAFVGEVSAQWLLYKGLFVTGGAGYYYATGTGPGIEAANGYAYGNVGLAWEHRHWRIEVGYYLTGDKARQVMPYPSADERVAGSVIWRF
ncbi:MAG TPA: TorF family putative porin [Steroidobacteraceae bacterium]|jgi:uncharacterized protein (TIGR02001 family)|nr:TorF family putative porin [Steroidobacteraceae bacterium]